MILTIWDQVFGIASRVDHPPFARSSKHAGRVARTLDLVSESILWLQDATPRSPPLRLPPPSSILPLPLFLNSPAGPIFVGTSTRTDFSSQGRGPGRDVGRLMSSPVESSSSLKIEYIYIRN